MDNTSKLSNLSPNIASGKCVDKWINFQSEAASQMDTTLRLVSPSTSKTHGLKMKGTKRKWGDADLGWVPRSLSLGLNCSPSTSDSSKRSSATVCTVSSVNVADEECSVDLDLNFGLKLDAEYKSTPKSPAVASKTVVSYAKPAVDLQLSLSVAPSASVITSDLGAKAQHLITPEASAMNCPALPIDDGSVSSCWTYLHSSGSSCVLPSQRFAPTKANLFPKTDLFSITREVHKNPVECTSGNVEKQHRSGTAKLCQFPGCLKGARGASGLCIAHGGGRRCQKSGCQKGAEGKTIYCKAHGGGRRCEHLGCTKSAEGRTDHCIAHGGGRRCGKDSCTRAARGKSGLCIRHGGGKRCRWENCTKSAEGQSGLCIAHGGGRRCQYPECTKGAQGSTMFCKAHGGGKRCNFPGCDKGAEGSTLFCKGHGGGKRCLFQGGGVCSKSVHGGTHFCVAHGGGKRCVVSGCTKSARGRTNFCVRHGGGKRCQNEGCGKSAQGSTNFCKAHGGGKRCSWGQPGSDIGGGDPPCERFARGKVGLCAAHSALTQDHRVHGGEMLGNLAAQNHEKMKGIAVEEDGSLHNFMISASVPEGRVHGGVLMALLARGAELGCSTSKGAP
ncbi:putative WRKY transcription factor 19 [Apostasia shenzhenica]|uniref:Putative WRKY transcription factor 19 n=1 Tax=Apostasia shenzhenica TaxID=1088818 RepID=A0A2I0AU27_9ASPA|nr:putative WRKY transcription factor 19 [Apostasia shenzhenica]